MKTFLLKKTVEDKDVVLRVKCDDYESACEYFSSVKKLSVETLLELYVVISS